MIEEIEINGYRLLNDFKADFNPLTVIIGANAVGKSSLIDCLQLIRLCCNYPLDNVFAQSSALEYVLTADGQTSALKWELTFFSFPRSRVGMHTGLKQWAEVAIK